MPKWKILDTETMLKTRQKIRESATLSGNVGSYAVPYPSNGRVLRKNVKQDLDSFTIEDYLKKLGF